MLVSLLSGALFHFCFFLTTQESGAGDDSRFQSMRIDGVAEVRAHEHYSESPARPALFLEVKNISLKNIRGYVVDILFIDTAPGVASHHAQAMVMTDPGGSPRVLQQGESERSSKPIIIVQNRQGHLATYRLRLDLVAFEDGYRWGPAVCQESQHLIKLLLAVDDIGRKGAGAVKP
jgi:hypothetical protein